MGQNKILDEDNLAVKTPLLGLPNEYDTLNGLPLGITDTGEIFLKTGAAASGGGGSDVNLAEIDGTTPSVGAGVADTGTLRVVLASNANSPTNLKQINGNTVSTGSGASDSGTLRVITATDGPTVSVLGTTTDAAVGDATGSINAHIRQVAKITSGVSVTLQNAASAIGNGTVLPVTGMATAVVQGTTTGTNTIVFEGSLDGTNWVAMNGRRLDNGTNYSTYNSSGAIFFFDVVGLMSFRCRISAYTSGSITLQGNAVPNAGNQVQVSTNSVNGGNVTIQTGSFGNVTDTSSNFTAMPPANDGTRPSGWVQYGMRYNTTTAVWERERNNESIVLLASASRTTTQTSADLVNYNARMLHVSIITSVIGTGSITVSIDAKDANGTYYNLLTSLAIITNTTTVLRIGPGFTAVANSTAMDMVPRTFRIVVTANNANAATYAVAYSLGI